MTFRLILCRHASSPLVDSRLEEPRDPGLLPGASDAASVISRMVADIPMVFVGTSPRRRCAETAQRARLPSPMTLPAFGPIEGREHETLVHVLRGVKGREAHDSRKQYFSTVQQFMPVLGELDQHVETLAASVKGSALIVTHAEIIAYILARWVGIESHLIGPVQVGSLTVIEFAQQPRLLVYNATAPTQLMSGSATDATTDGETGQRPARRLIRRRRGGTAPTRRPAAGHPDGPC